MENLKNQIDNQIEILKRMISENENKEEIFILSISQKYANYL